MKGETEKSMGIVENKRKKLKINKIITSFVRTQNVTRYQHCCRLIAKNEWIYFEIIIEENGQEKINGKKQNNEKVEKTGQKH